MRREYDRGMLLEEQAGSDPVALFHLWMEAAVQSGNPEPTAMNLATADSSGRPSSRTVLLKEAGTEGFVFFSNYSSRKGSQLAENPHAALAFFWPELDRQVRVEGKVSRIAGEASDQYFFSRPRASQIGAWVSPQSETIPGRSFLEDRMKALEAQFADTTVPRPPHWGGYLLQPDMIEFWQGRPGRMHDRLRYRLENGQWVRERLAP